MRVDGPGLPSTISVVRDIGVFAQRRGFVRVSIKPGPPDDAAAHTTPSAVPDVYRFGTAELEVSRQTADHRVVAYLYAANPQNDSQFIERFYREFDREYAKGYGGEDRISETAYADDTGGSSGSLGTLGSGGTPESSSPLQSGVPAIGGGPSAASDPAGRQ